jgi:starch synthase
MNILFAASEAVPLAKTGGLADVTGSLPKTLNEQGADVRVILPAYGHIPDADRALFRTVGTFKVRLGWRNQTCSLLEAEIGGIHYYLIDNEYYYKRESLYGYGDEAERFVFFCFAVMESLPYLGFLPDVIHCHDWQTGMIPFLLRTRYHKRPLHSQIKTVFTIHNLQYQGIFSQDILKDLLSAGSEFFTPESLEFYGDASCMKAGLLYADKLTTVSKTYASEIQDKAYGERLEGVLQLRKADLSGIVNGIDTNAFDPMTDPEISFPYRLSLNKKRKNKLVLQQELGLAPSESVPVVGIVARLTEQKGFDLIEEILDDLAAENIQLAVLGTGERRFEEMFREAAADRPDSVAFHAGFNDGLARRIYAGSDMFLMPSRFEPCGLSQLIALRYLSVPIVRETGGLKDTVQPFDVEMGTGNGFSFKRYRSLDLLRTIQRALLYYRQEDSWKTIVTNGSHEDFGWNRPARNYLQIYKELLS